MINIYEKVTIHTLRTIVMRVDLVSMSGWQRSVLQVSSSIDNSVVQVYVDNDENRTNVYKDLPGRLM